MRKPPLAVHVVLCHYADCFDEEKTEIVDFHLFNKLCHNAVSALKEPSMSSKAVIFEHLVDALFFILKCCMINQDKIEKITFLSKSFQLSFLVFLKA